MDLLVADDDRNARLYLELALTSLRHTVVVAKNGAEVLELLEQFAFDALLIDVEMPAMNGTEALARIRANPALRHLPVYAITAHSAGPALEAVRRAGFSCYLTKPYSPVELAQLLAGGGARQTALPQDAPLVDPVTFASYKELLQDAGVSPSVTVKRTLDTVQAWLAEHPESTSSTREIVHGLAGSCAVIGASALREAMTKLERLAATGDSARWNEALSDLESVFEETHKHYCCLLDGSGPPQ